MTCNYCKEEMWYDLEENKWYCRNCNGGPFITVVTNKSGSYLGIDLGEMPIWTLAAYQPLCM